jgi:uncharacterized protein YabE (DUF348 family)
MAGGSLGYSLTGATAQTVTVSADGQTRTFHAYGDDVASLLRKAGVSVGAHDVVAPALGERLHNGARVVIARGRPLTLSVDGSQRTVWVTQGTLADAVDSLGMRLDGAYVSANRSRTIPLSGLSLTVRMPQQVTLVVGGVSSTVTTTEPTVAQLLSDQNVQLGQWDSLSTSLDAYPTTGSTVTVVRETHTQWLQRNKIAVPTLRVKDHHLTIGTVQLAHDGRAGMHYRLWGIVKVDGAVSSMKLLQERTVKAKPKVLLVGTKPKQAAVVQTLKATTSSTPTAKPTTHTTHTTTTHTTTKVPTTSKGSGLNWAALAQCESGGDASLVDGSYYGLYQFSLGTWQAVGGHGRPSDASSAEQTYRAKLLYAQQGRAPWPSCGHLL